MRIYIPCIYSLLSFYDDIYSFKSGIIMLPLAATVFSLAVGMTISPWIIRSILTLCVSISKKNISTCLRRKHRIVLIMSSLLLSLFLALSPHPVHMTRYLISTRNRIDLSTDMSPLYFMLYTIKFITIKHGTTGRFGPKTDDHVFWNTLILL